MIASTHNHSTGSDGKLTPEQVVKKAISLGWDYIYFTDHYTNNSKFATKEKHLNFFNEDYVQEVKRLKEKYKNKIKVYFGVEFDWIQKYKKWIKNQLKKYDFDYVIGSIHKLRKNKKYFGMEPGKEKWIKNLKKFRGGKRFIQEYYKQIRNIAKSGIFDSVGHFDYVKVYNENNEIFNENEDWYKKEVSKSLNIIKKYNIVLEMNISGIRKCNSPFPSLKILKQAKGKNIPITLGLDAHYKEHYSNKDFKKLINLAKKAGYNEVVRFEKRKLIKEKL